MFITLFKSICTIVILRFRVPDDEESVGRSFSWYHWLAFLVNYGTISWARKAQHIVFLLHGKRFFGIIPILHQQRAMISLCHEITHTHTHTPSHHTHNHTLRDKAVMSVRLPVHGFPSVHPKQKQVPLQQIPKGRQLVGPHVENWVICTGGVSARQAMKADTSTALVRGSIWFRSKVICLTKLPWSINKLAIVRTAHHIISEIPFPIHFFLSSLLVVVDTRTCLECCRSEVGLSLVAPPHCIRTYRPRTACAPTSAIVRTSHETGAHSLCVCERPFTYLVV